MKSLELGGDLVDFMLTCFLSCRGVFESSKSKGDGTIDKFFFSPSK